MFVVIIIVEKKVNKYAFESLKRKALSHSKSLEILSGVQNQPVSRRSAYLKENTLTREDCQLLFKLRTKMLNVKTNFSNQYDNELVCQTCKKPESIENENHLLECDMLKSENFNPEVRFEFVFQNLEKQVMALKTYKSILRKREILLKYQ